LGRRGAPHAGGDRGFLPGQPRRAPLARDPDRARRRRACRHGKPSALRPFDPFYPAFSHCTPWLDSLFVEQAFRRRGIGAKLAEAVTVLAGKLGHAEIYLGTPDQQKLYASMGWRWLADDPGIGHEMSSIMVRTIAPR
jgi:GNAT superfamily N-acetyltransferase